MAKGLFITADGQTKAQGEVLERETALQEIEHCLTQLRQLAPATEQAQALEADIASQLAMLDARLTPLNDMIHVHGPQGVAFTSGEHLPMAASQNVALNVGGDISLGSMGNTTLMSVDWKSLLKPIADDLDLDVEREWDLVTLAQYHANASAANRSKLNELLVFEFSSGLAPTENHEIPARLPIQAYWTTNYDKLIERSLERNGKIPDVKYTNKQLATTRPRRDAVVYKMHGDVAHASEAALNRDDCERYHIKMQPFITALSGDLIAKIFLGVQLH